jgi:hypothetical protein
LQSGKFFAADAKSTIHFRPVAPWQQIPPADFKQLMTRIEIINT